MVNNVPSSIAQKPWKLWPLAKYSLNRSERRATPSPDVLDSPLPTTADGDPSNIYERPGGAKSLGVYLFDQQPGKPDFTVYDVEVDCRNKRARVTGGARLQQRGQYLAQAQVLQSMAGRSTTVVGAKS